MHGEEGTVTKKKVRENATREDPEESGGTFPPSLSVTHFSFFPLLPLQPLARAAALFMTLSTSLAAVFLRHYTWKNSAPRKLDIEPRRGCTRCPEEDTRVLCVSSRRRAALPNLIRYEVECATSPEDREERNKPYLVMLVLLVVYAKMNYNSDD